MQLMLDVGNEVTVPFGLLRGVSIVAQIPGNRGVNLGISCVSCGVHGRNEFSWVVHYGKFAVKHWAL
jgi:hypothetical protein